MTHGPPEAPDPAHAAGAVGVAVVLAVGALLRLAFVAP